MCTFNVHLICFSPDSEFSAIVSSNIFCLFGPFFPSESQLHLKWSCEYCLMCPWDAVHSSSCINSTDLYSSISTLYSFISIVLLSSSTLSFYVTHSWVFTWFFLMFLFLYWICIFWVSTSIKPSFNTCLKIPSCKTDPQNQSCCFFFPDGGSIETEVSKTAGPKW